MVIAQFQKLKYFKPSKIFTLLIDTMFISVGSQTLIGTSRKIFLFIQEIKFFHIFLRVVSKSIQIFQFILLHCLILLKCPFSKNERQTWTLHICLYPENDNIFLICLIELSFVNQSSVSFLWNLFIIMSYHKILKTVFHSELHTQGYMPEERKTINCFSQIPAFRIYNKYLKY